MASHIALLGDSIFDNHSYTGGDPDVVSHLRDLLPAPWRATLCALDGSVCVDLPQQIAAVSADASHLVVSIGGNDALMNIDMLGLPVRSTAEALTLFGERIREFEADYRYVIDAAIELRRHTTVCTIYNGNLDAAQAPLARIALMMFNDVILRFAIERRIDVIDLRLVCSDPADYANPIEPSGSGGRKIAAAIARSILGDLLPARVFAG